jgi:phospholipid/cholesterol/gamma-HCH transport system substrate-binding protein
MGLSKDAKIGIIVISVFLTLYYIVFVSKLITPPEPKRYNIYAVWDNINGLREKSAVKMKGVSVGEVGTIEFSSKKQKAKVTLKINLSQEIPENSIFTIQSGLIGDKWVAIDPDPSMSSMIKPEMEIEGVTLLSMADNFRMLKIRLIAFNKNIAQVKEKTEKINNIIADEKFKKEVKAKVFNIRKGTEDLNKTILASEDSINVFSENLQNSLYVLTSDMSVMARDIRNNINVFLGGVSSSVSHMDKKVNRFGQDISVIIKDLKKSSDDICMIVDKITANLDPQKGIPPKIRMALLSLRESCMFIEEGAQGILAFSEKGPMYQNDIKQITSSVRKAMARIDGSLTGMLGYVEEEEKDITQIKAEYEIIITRSNDNFNGDIYANLFLSDKDKSDKFLNLGIVDVNTERTTVSAQIGKIVTPDLTLRGGIVKSSLGAGLDYKLGKKTTLSMDVFDFSQRNAFIDVKGRYNIQDNFELVLGVDDVLDEKKLKMGFGIKF